MKNRLMVAVLSILMAAPVTAVAQFGALRNAIPGAGGQSSSVSADTIVTQYQQANGEVSTAQDYFLQSLKIDTDAEKRRIASKNLVEGATKEAIADARVIQTEANKRLEEKMQGEKLALDDEGKKAYGLGLISMAAGIKGYMDLSTAVKDFRPGVASLSGSGAAAVEIAKNLPADTADLVKTLKLAVTFAQANGIEVPEDATKLL